MPDKHPLELALSRFMSSANLREAVDTVRAEPALLGGEAVSYLEESIRQLKQQGERELVERVAHWLRLLQTFRRFGVEEGFLELLADSLVRADHDEMRRLLSEYPELSTDAARRYFERREDESHGAVDQQAASKYGLAAALPDMNLAESPLDLDVGSVGEFLAGYVDEDDDERRVRFLADHPAVTRPPAALLAESMFQPRMDQAWADLDLVLLRGLYLRRALFRRAWEVGVGQAIREYEEGAEWPELLTT